MSKAQTASNPFYVLLIIAAILFVITVCAYFTMALREAHGAVAGTHGLTALLARYGLSLLIAELVLLGLATFGAIATDDYFSRQRNNNKENERPATDRTRPTNHTNATDTTEETDE